MSGSDRGEQFPPWVKALASVGLALAASALIAGLSYQIRYAQQAEHGAAEYARITAYESYKPCRTVPLTKLDQCFVNAQREYDLKHNDNRRNYADLVAQQRSALWTAIMGIAALIGMALSAIGVWLVYTTFHETRKANEIAEREQRPWLTFEIEDISHFTWVDDSLRGELTIKVENVGKAPAIGVKIRSIHNGAVRHIEVILAEFERWAGQFSADRWGSWILPGQTFGQKVPFHIPKDDIEFIELAGKKAFSPLLGIGVVYATPLVPGVFQTASTFLLGCHSGKDDGMLRMLFLDEMPAIGRNSTAKKHPGGDRLT